MMKDKTCEGCVWFDKCGCDEPCEYYDSADPEEISTAAEEEYMQSLHERQKIVVQILQEQDS